MGKEGDRLHVRCLQDILGAGVKLQRKVSSPWGMSGVGREDNSGGRGVSQEKGKEGTKRVGRKPASLFFRRV